MTPEQTEALVRRLRRMNDAVKGGRPVFLPDGSVSRLDLIERRLIAAVRRANTPGPEQDGYPSGHRGGGATDEESIDYHPDSSAQHAAFGRLKGVPKDEVLEDALTAYRLLETAVNAIGELAVRLDLIDERAKSEKHSNAGGSCIICDRHVEGTAVDRLRRGMCHTDFTAWTRSGRPDIMDFRRMRAEAA